MRVTLRGLLREIGEDMKNPCYRGSFIFRILFVPGAKYIFHHRVCFYLSGVRLLRPLHFVYSLYLHHLRVLYGIELSFSFHIPRHFTVAHCGGIVFHPRSCGEKVYVRQGVTVGNDGKSGAGPVIGNNVSFGAHSIVIGGIEIGDGATIGAGAVVTRDVSPGATVAGVPAKAVKTNDTRNGL